MKTLANLVKVTLLLAVIAVMGVGVLASPATADVIIDDGGGKCTEGTTACYDADNQPHHYFPEN